MGRPIVLVAAVASNGVIGKDGAMPWRVRADLRHFRALTMGKPVIMGRKTYESIGRPLDGRTNIVVSRSPNAASDAGEETPVLFTNSLDSALKLAEEVADQVGEEEICVIGGGRIYSQIIDRAHRLEVTEILVEPKGDTFFPEIDEKDWMPTSRTPLEPREGDTASAELVVYVRTTAS